MKKVIKKTEAERQEEITEERVSVESTRFFYWACDNCNTAFFEGDVIIRTSDGISRCPNMVRGGLLGGVKICRNHMYGGDEKTFNDYYKLVE